MNFNKQFRKRGLALFLALVMCLSLVQVTAFAEEDEVHEHAYVDGLCDECGAEETEEAASVEEETEETEEAASVEEETDETEEGETGEPGDDTLDENDKTEEVVPAEVEETEEEDSGISTQDGDVEIQADPSENSVAEVNGEYYASLEAAIRAAQPGDTVVLLADVTESVTVADSKNITLDLNGNKLTNAAGVDYTIKVSSATLTVDDSSTGNEGSIESIESSGYGISAIGSSAVINIEGGNVYGKSRGLSLTEGAKGTVSGENTVIRGGEGTKGYGIFVSNGNTPGLGTELTVMNGKISGGSEGIGLRAGAKCTINDGTISGGEVGIGTPTYNANSTNPESCTCILNGGTVLGPELGVFISSNHSFTMNGGKIEKTVYKESDENWYTTIHVKGMSELQITGGTVLGEITIEDVCAVDISGGHVDKLTNLNHSDPNHPEWENNPKITVSGGTFGNNVSEYCADDAVALPTADGKYVVGQAEDIAVAMIGEQPYISIEAAIAAAVDGDTVQIVKPGTYPGFTIPAGVTVKGIIGATKEESTVITSQCGSKGLGYRPDGKTNVPATATAAVENLWFEGETGSALYVTATNLTVTGCKFVGMKRGIYDLCDNEATGKLTFTNNTFVNVTVPFDGYWGYTLEDSVITITDNIFEGCGYIQLWDYSQFLAWRSDKTDPGEVKSVINAVIEGNEGDVTVLATHCNWFESSKVDTGNVKVTYCPLVEIKNWSDNIVSAVAKPTSGKLIGFEDHTKAEGRTNWTGKHAFYYLPVDDYVVEVTYSNGVVAQYDLSVAEPQAGTTQILSLSSETPRAARIGETEYETLAEAIEAIEGEGTVTLLADVVVDAALTIDKTVTIEGNGYTLSRKTSAAAADAAIYSQKAEGSFQANGLRVGSTAKDKKFPYTETVGFNLFDVRAGGNLTLKGTTINGGAEWTKDSEYKLDTFSGPVATKPVFQVAGTLTLDGTTVSGVCATVEGAVIKATGGANIILTGSSITGCISDQSGIVANLTTANLTITDSHLDNNYCYAGVNHAVIKAYSGSQVTMESGTVSGNCYYGNGLIGMWDGDNNRGSTFTMNGGSINNNHYVAVINNNHAGTVVYPHKNATFTMNGGEMLNNVIGEIGGVVIDNGAIEVNLLRGTISGTTKTLIYDVTDRVYDVYANGMLYTIGADMTVGDVAIESRVESTGTITGDVYLLDAGASIQSNSKLDGKVISGVEGYCVVATEVESTYTYALGQPTEGEISVSLNRSSATLYSNTTSNTVALVATTNPENAMVTWTSSDESVATVNANGVVTAVANGTATITAKVGDATAACTVTVTAYVQPEQPHTHSYTVTVTAPTCTAQGYTTHTCACGDSYVDTYVDALGHTWDNGVVTTAATYTSEGVRTYTCTVCGATRTESIPQLTYPYYPSYPTGTTTQPGTPTTTIPDSTTPLDPGTTITDGETPLTGISFLDVLPGAWYFDAVQYAAIKGLMNGVGDMLFAPDMSTERGMIVTILHRLEGTPAADAATFADVEAGQWYADAVNWGAANGVVTGYSETEFAPLQNITREQMATILFRYAQLKGYDTSKRADLSAFTDASSISAYALEAMQWAVAEGLITGVTESTLVPGGNATRAQAAMILMRFCENVAA